MLTINQSDISTRFIVTVSEINTVTSGSTLELFNQFTNVSTTYNLPADTSAYPTRYNEFVFSSSTFSGLSTGTYTYTIKDSTSATTETGLLKVVGDVLTQQELVDDIYTYIQPSSTDDDFIVYEQ